ncbi:MAG: histidinol-phosphate transaminase [Flammeovirgaceae bacterium]
MFDIKSWIRPHLLNLKPYSSARDEYTGKEGVFLDANENSIGSVGGGEYNRYPDPYQYAIKAKLSEIKGVPTNQIFLGNGSDEAIDLLIRAFCEPKEDNIIILPPTYGMYQVSANIHAIKVKEVLLSEDYDLRPEAILDAVDNHTKLIFVCNPNNPTANSLTINKIEKLLHDFKGVVVIDEAYIDFSSQPSFSKRLSEFSNLVVMQTFSKAWGLAALRLGIAFASVEIISVLNKIKPPYNINLLTQKFVLEALTHASDKDKMVAEILENRKWLAENLLQVPYIQKVYPTDANFLLAKMPKPKEVYQKLVENFVIVRDRSSVRLCEGCLRITVGTKQENQILIETMKNIKL